MENFNFSTILQHFINGLTVGGIYAFIALGYTMVYGILKFINFAHGEILMMGTYISLIIYDVFLNYFKTPFLIFVAFIISLIIGICFGVTLGVSVEILAYKPLRNAPRLAPLLSAIGVSIILSNLAAFLFGTKSKKFQYPFDNTPITISGISISPNQLMILILSLILMVGLKIFIDKTKTGKAMRAASENQKVASLMGININRIISITFAIGSGLAVIAGVLIALDYKVYPTMGTMAGLKAFIAAVVGGIGNISGAMLGGIILGLLETFGTAVLGLPVGFKDIIAFGVLIIILLFKPEGILGKKTREKV
ncbi:MAG TPA: branched-chain amino acid ABC transporter permease [Spirochaetota bacterium]|nr:branched-chain amino acid ABC transporter permease [Spirochaetota bacterium]HOL57397.1 branched-chain amino acid ABC transporter permease [Spirochaetota bacterium]HPP04963.1 branched-chain amino acid ABC transporter permease [Spirochaetota bacterium]